MIQLYVMYILTKIFKTLKLILSSLSIGWGLQKYLVLSSPAEKKHKVSSTAKSNI